MKKINYDLASKISELIIDGVTGSRAIAKILGTSHQSAWRTTKAIEQEIITLNSKGLSREQIKDTLRINKHYIDSVFEKNRISDKKIFNINDLISFRLLYHCEDIELLTKRIALELAYKKPEKVIIPTRLCKTVKKDKINKIFNILNYVGISCDLEYADANGGRAHA